MELNEGNCCERKKTHMNITKRLEKATTNGRKKKVSNQFTHRMSAFDTNKCRHQHHILTFHQNTRKKTHKITAHTN